MERQVMQQNFTERSTEPWLRRLRNYFCWGLLLVMAGCAAPQKPAYDFIPPASKAGLACLQSCQAQSAVCERKVDLLVNQCVVKAGQQARTELPGRLAAYENSLVAWEAAVRRYERDVSMYELQMRHYRMMNHLSYPGCRDKKGKVIRDCRPRGSLLRSPFWSDRPVFPGKMPPRPTLNSVQAEIAGKTCNQQKDQCVADYRQCYTGCGGTVKLR